MGNNNSIAYSIEKFVADVNTKDLHNINPDELKLKVVLLLDIFEKDNKAYTHFKRREEATLISNKNISLKEGDENIYEDEEDDMDIEEVSKSKKFLNVLTYLINLNFSAQLTDMYLILIKIMSYLVHEREFLKFFMRNSVEQVCNMITVNELKFNLEFYLAATKLVRDVLEIFILDTKLIADFLPGLRKIAIVPKKINDKNFCKHNVLKVYLLETLKSSLRLLRDLNEQSKDKKFSKRNDYIDFVKYTITEYYNSTIFMKLTEDFQTSSEYDTQMTILQSFNFLSQIGFVITDQYIRCDKEVKHMTTLLEKSKPVPLLAETLKFLINFHISSYNLDVYSNFKLFLAEEADLEESLFELFEQTESDEIKFLISCLFLCISIMEGIWTKLKKINIIKPTSRFILLYLSKTFTLNFNEQTDENKAKLTIVNFLIKILSFVCEEKNFKRIYHIDFFKNYFDIVVLLFHINHFSYRMEILNILSIFTYFYDCKLKMVEEKNEGVIKLIHVRMVVLFAELQKLYKIYSECEASKNKLIAKKESITIIEYKNKFQENINLFENSCINTKNIFFKTTQEFGLLMTVFVNLMLMNDYNSNIGKICDKDFLREKKLNNPTEPDRELTLNKENGKDSGGYLIQYDDFFKSLECFKHDFQNIVGSYGFMNKYLIQIVLARLINNPLGRIEFDKFKSETEDVDSAEMINLSTLYDMIKEHLNDHDIIHKLLYATNRFISFSRKIKNMIETVKKITEEIKQFLYIESSSSVIVNRECLRLLCTLTMFSDQTLLWLKFDSKKLHIDYSNYSDVLLKYKNSEINWTLDNEEHNEKILFLPYKKVKAYADKMGVIFYGEHVLILPKRLNLGRSFTIMFRFYNPVIMSENWHVLIQGPTGIGGLIVIDKSRKRLGCFTEDGEFIDSGIDLSNNELNKKWVHVALSFQSCPDPKNKNQSEQTKLYWYLEGELVKKYDSQKMIIPRTIQYVGNSRDYTEPFGIFCDLRIYRNFSDEKTIKYIYYGEENKKMERSEFDLLHHLYHKIMDYVIRNFLVSLDTSEETFYFSIKFFNNIMSNKLYRNKFINYSLIMKINTYFNSRKIETKKEISKFLQTIA